MVEANVLPFAAHDLITDFMHMTSTDDTPELYRKWSAISLVAGALERRVWAQTGYRAGKPRYTYPNLFVFLVGAPGVGKYIIESVQELWIDAKASDGPAFHVAPSNLTKASLVDALLKAERTTLKASPVFQYHSLLVAAEEFGVFLPTHDTNFISVLNKIYNCPDRYSETRRHGPAQEVFIENPVLNIIAGVQPSWLATVFPEEAWGMGLTSRIMMVYGAAGAPQNPFTEGREQAVERLRLVHHLTELSYLYGEIKWTAEAVDKIVYWWVNEGGSPRPAHSKLEHYCNRRILHAQKLAMISSVSRTLKVSKIEAYDVERAIIWLIEAEKLMPDVFRAMVGRSDHQIIEELYNHLVTLYAMSKNSPIHGSKLVAFLIQRVPSDKIRSIMDTSEQSGLMERVGGTDTYRPKSKAEFVE